MREIKFRGRRLKDDMWVYGNYVKMLVDITCNGEVYENYIVETSISNTPDRKPTYLTYHRVNPETTGQYTGEKDDNKIEIYVGDKLLCTDADGNVYTTIVECDGGAFVVDVSGCDYDRTTIGWALEQDIVNCKVIGNIHDNSGLGDDNDR